MTISVIRVQPLPLVVMKPLTKADLCPSVVKISRQSSGSGFRRASFQFVKISVIRVQPFLPLVAPTCPAILSRRNQMKAEASRRRKPLAKADPCFICVQSVAKNYSSRPHPCSFFICVCCRSSAPMGEGQDEGSPGRICVHLWLKISLRSLCFLLFRLPHPCFICVQSVAKNYSSRPHPCSFFICVCCRSSAPMGRSG